MNYWNCFINIVSEVAIYDWLEASKELNIV